MKDSKTRHAFLKHWSVVITLVIILLALITASIITFARISTKTQAAQLSNIVWPVDLTSSKWEIAWGYHHFDHVKSQADGIDLETIGNHDGAASPPLNVVKSPV